MLQSNVFRRGSSILSSRPKLRLGLLLSAPLLWLGLVYVVALIALLISSLWTVDSFTGELERTWSTSNFVTVLTSELYRIVTFRTVTVAVLVTIIDIVIALPIAFFMAKVASKRSRRILVVLVLLPLWASYLVKVYAWRSLLANEGLIDWIFSPLGTGTPGYGITSTVITLSYLWLPYVILPIYAGLEKVPDSLLEASSDLGASNWRTIRTVIFPLLLPAVAAASIFSFSLTLGDYITVNIVGGPNQFIGNLIYSNVGAAGNLPLAATISLIPIVIMFIYLALMRRTGALNNM